MDKLDLPKKIKILVSGMPPSNGGVGRLMRQLVPRAKERGFSVVCKRENQSLREIVKGGQALRALEELTKRIIDKFIFFVRTQRIKNATVLFIYPQVAGFNTLFNLAKRNTVFLYVMDNSFFCLRSYNNHPTLHSECLICINNPLNVLDQCVPFPGGIQKITNTQHLQKLKDVSGKIIFLAQNENQKALLQMHFGDEIRCVVVGQDADELVARDVREMQPKTSYVSYDLVYHGADHVAKGVGHFVYLASLLPELTCFIPSTRSAVEKVIGTKVTSSNIVFKECTWETGLKQVVESARLILVPSLWSAPIEGALLKSIYHNGNVAIVETQFGFAQEVANKCKVISLSTDAIKAAQNIRIFFQESNDFSGNTKTWLNEFLLSNGIENVFTAISRENDYAEP